MRTSNVEVKRAVHRFLLRRSTFDVQCSTFVFLLIAMLSATAQAVAPGGAYRTGDAISLTLDSRLLPHTLGYHQVHGTAIYHGRKLQFYAGVFLPPVFFHTHAPMPVVMTLHNKFAIGYEGGGMMLGEGMGQMLATGRPDGRATGDKPANPISLRQDAEFIGLVPQCPPGFGWEDPAMANLLCRFIEQVVAHYHADDDRVYLTGFSYGASSAWRVALNAPDRFAALICCDGRATPDPAEDVAKLRNIGIYLEVGEWDGDFVGENDRMHQALNMLPHRDYIFQMIPGGNHFNYQSVYTDPLLWKWLLAHHRHHAAATTQTVDAQVH
jgi:hypothetical protein